MVNRLTSISAASDENIGYTSVVLRKAANFANVLQIKADIDTSIEYMASRFARSIACPHYYRWTSASVNFLIPFSFSILIVSIC